LFRSSHSSYPQVCSPALRSIARNDGPFFSTADHSDTIGAECSRSIQGDCVPSQFSKPYLMYSATDATSAALDFSKGNVEDGVVDSPPSRSADCLPSPLRDCRSTPIRQCSRSPAHHNVRTPQRQLYCKASLDMDEAKEKDHVHYNINIPVERGLVSPASQSQAAVRPRHLDKEGRLLRTQSLSNQRSPGYSSRELLSVGPTAYSSRRQSYLQPSLCSLIRQCRERERASSGITLPKAYSHRDEILRRIAKLKSKEMGTKEVKKP
jgi:hypothetical protein